MRRPVGLGITLLGVVALFLTIAMLVLPGWERPPIESVQKGYRGLGMAAVYNPRTFEDTVAENQPPTSLDWELSDDPTLASEVYENVPVLGHLTVDQFNRLMAAITEWVAPEQGCAYCHGEEGDYASDHLYTKVVSARMIQMTQNINANWSDHVAPSGVNCYTCHRGQNVPQNIWFNLPARPTAAGFTRGHAGQNYPAENAAWASLPYDPFTPFLLEDAANIRVVSTTALPVDNRRSIKQTEWSYSLMMHMSEGLGVNCTYCHNSRSFFAWDQSTPQRETAYSGLQMVRDVNSNYLVPLTPQYPPHRLGPLGDGPKANCATCHNGVYKPMFGAEMVAEYPELTEVSSE